MACSTRCGVGLVLDECGGHTWIKLVSGYVHSVQQFSGPCTALYSVYSRLVGPGIAAQLGTVCTAVEWIQGAMHSFDAQILQH
jgi:hypothetical protein